MRPTAVAVLATLACPSLGAAQSLVYQVAVEGGIDHRMARVITRAIAAAESNRGMAVLLEIASDDRDLEAVGEVLEAIGAATVPVYALVRQPTSDAGTVIALAADSLFVGPDASLSVDTATPAFRGIGLPQVAARRLRDVATALPQGPTSRVALDAHGAAALEVAQRIVDGRDAVLDAVRLPGARLVAVDARWLGATIDVENRNWQDVRIYLVRSSTRVRLGTVTSMSSVTFELPEDHLPPGSVIRVLAEAIGSSDRVETESVRAQPGLVVEWAIENVLLQSSYFVWIRR